MSNHNIENCQCASCKSIRGEYKGENCPNYGRKLNHKPNCPCGVCKTKRGEIGGKNHPMSGRNHTEEAKQKISKSLTGHTVTEETKRKQSEVSLGENNPNWQGGISKLPYPFDFNEELKELVRKGDNYTCQLCGLPQKESRRKLDVHHIDYIKENLDPENLLTLCSGCNIKVNHNRKSWTKFFSLREQRDIN
jgi:hypothetical protein